MEKRIERCQRTRVARLLIQGNACEKKEVCIQKAFNNVCSSALTVYTHTSGRIEIVISTRSFPNIKRTMDDASLSVPLLSAHYR